MLTEFQQKCDKTQFLGLMRVTESRDPEADTTALEREIDRFVYALYDLTPEEIAIVEGEASW